ncbi:MAG: glycerol-3-phosphate dehydrogenase [Solirubrobacteraceae bacterium]|nr:glycerol-3-phosphate dehydrogenase [Solirubrobacteraceae bacterium]
MLWARRAELADAIDGDHVNPDYLPDHQLCEDLSATSDLGEALDGADAVFVAVPSHGFRETLERMDGHVGDDVPVVSLTKGFEQRSHKRMTELIEEILPGRPAGALAGPNLAKEILDGYAAAAVIAMTDTGCAREIQGVLRQPLFRIYEGDDIIGVEVAGALKNVIAIAAGMAEGLGVGDNPRAMVITRGLAEITRLGVAMGGEPATFAGLTGLGDLMATCMSPLSRNRRVGEELARGKTIEEVIEGMNQVAEGVKSARTVMELAADHACEMPIAAEVDAVVNEGRTPQEAYRGLARPAAEHELHGVA